MERDKRPMPISPRAQPYKTISLLSPSSEPESARRRRRRRRRRRPDDHQSSRRSLLKCSWCTGESEEHGAMGKTPVRMKAVVYALSPFQQKMIPGLWKDLPSKIHHKVSENWLSATVLLAPLIGGVGK